MRPTVLACLLVLLLLGWRAKSIAQVTVFAPPGGSQTLQWSCGDTVTATEYLNTNNVGNCTAGDNTVSLTRFRVLKAGRIVSGKCYASAGPNTGGTWTQTIRLNGGNTLAVCTLVEATNPLVGTFTNLPIALAPDDEIAIQHVDSDGAFDGASVGVALEVDK